MKINNSSVILIYLFSRNSHSAGVDGLGGLGAIVEIIIPILIVVFIVLFVFFLIKSKQYLFSFIKETGHHRERSTILISEINIDQITWLVDKERIIMSLRTKNEVEKHYAIDLLEQYAAIDIEEAKIMLNHMES